MNDVVAPEAEIDQAEAGRAGAYRILASLLSDAPPQDVLQEIAQLPVQDGQEDDISIAFAGLSDACTRFTEAQVAEEYQVLFIGVGRGEVVPYGSFYITGFLMEKPLGELRDDLAALGFSRDETVKEPEDHIAFLCEVMDLMISDGDEFSQQSIFFEKHIAPWAERLFKDIQAAEATEFYAHVAKLGLAFMAFEKTYFSMSV